jgi:AcrR family transcriptional regulator
MTASPHLTTPSSHGRQRIIESALELSYQGRSFSSLGIREITRHAQLSAPAFYRHFDNLNALGMAMIEQVKADVLAAFGEIRLAVADQLSLDIRPLLLQRFFDLVLENPRAVIIGACEAYGPMPEMRMAIRSALRQVAEDIATDLHIARLLEGIPRDYATDILTHVAHHVFFLAIDYLDRPQDRPAIFHSAEQMVATLFAGARALGGQSNA